MTIKSRTAPFTVLHIPHSSTAIPDEIKKGIIISDNELKAELLKMTDHYTSEIFSIEPEEAATVVFPFSRLVADPERFIDDKEEIMSACGMGAIYTRTSDGQRLRNDPSESERRRLIEKYYIPHHNRFLQAVQSSLDVWGGCLIIDCHSFPSKPLPCETDQDPSRPDICIGTDSFHTPGWVTEIIIKAFEEKGFRVKLNSPFGGTIVPLAYYQRNSAVISIMIELNRTLYMNESTGVKLPGHNMFSSIIRELLKQIKETHSKIKTW